MKCKRCGRYSRIGDLKICLSCYTDDKKKEINKRKKLHLIKEAKKSANKHKHTIIITPYKIVSGGA